MSEQMGNSPKLWELVYQDSDRDVRLVVYADTLAFDRENGKNLIVALRFGGYPEQVRAMATAIYGGGQVYLFHEEKRYHFQGVAKCYRQFFTNDGLYMEATLILENSLRQADDDKKEESELPRTVYLYCAKDSDESLFEQLDAAVSVPLIAEFRDFVLTRLKEARFLKKLEMLASEAQFDVWRLELSKDERNIISLVEWGLKTEKIAISGDYTEENAFDEVTSVSSYLNRFGKTIADKIQNQFMPLFDPAKESISREIRAVNANIQRQAGYGLYDAQLAVSEAIMRSLCRNKTALCTAECGTGKSKIGVPLVSAGQSQLLCGADEGEGAGWLYAPTDRCIQSAEANVFVSRLRRGSHDGCF